MSSTLRSKVIRLAHANPELRPHLLPLLKEAGCEKLPEGGMRDNCEKKKEEGKEASGRTASVKPIYGHDSPDTAYVVESYPYGSLRTQAKFWLEANPTKGFRFFMQTLDPKRHIWNKPKASTYTEWGGAMYLDEKGHVQWEGVGQYSGGDKILDFVTKFPGANMTILKKIVPVAIKMRQKLLAMNEQGLSGFTINGVPQKADANDLARNQKELADWTEILKKI